MQHAYSPERPHLSCDCIHKCAQHLYSRFIDFDSLFSAKYVVFLNNKDNLYEHLCQLYLQSGKTKADLDGYYFGIRLRPEFRK